MRDDLAGNCEVVDVRDERDVPALGAIYRGRGLLALVRFSMRMFVLALLVAAGTPKSAGAKTPSETPSREAVVAAMSAISPAVNACANGRERGLAQVRMQFRGSDGVVTAASWQDAQSARFSPDAQACILRAARHARVPSFRRETFTVSYPFRLR